MSFFSNVWLLFEEDDILIIVLENQPLLPFSFNLLRQGHNSQGSPTKDETVLDNSIFKKGAMEELTCDDISQADL